MALLLETYQLFKRYESELLPLLADREEYVKNHVTHKAERDISIEAMFDANRQIHLKLIYERINGVDTKCDYCEYLGCCVCKCEQVHF